MFKNTVLFAFFIIFSCSSRNFTDKNINQNKNINLNSNATKDTILKLGAENYEVYLPILKDKNVGIVTNQTGVLPNHKHLVDFLIEKNISLKKIFAPEHGFRGTADAGELIKDGKDLKTSLPIISLYGNNKKPKPEQLKDLEIIVFDIQDVGARFYTYISTLHYVMEACAEENIKLIVLDRPNPNIDIIDGPVLEPEHSSFVGMHTIPVLHGMTIGEYALMINGEKWLKNKAECNLTVVACKNYNRKMFYSLPIKPSPNLPNDQAINLYASLCFFEGTNVSVGRGTEKQFQVYGSPLLPKENFNFIPKPNQGAKEPLYNGKVCYGEDLSNIKKVNKLEIKWLIKAYKETIDKSVFFNSFFTKLAGTKKLQQQIENNISEDDIRKSWENEIKSFKKMRTPYLLYM